jgi:nitroreductase
MQDRKAITSVPIHDLLARRWSPRAFDVNRPVTREQLVTIMEAGRWAPSCNGDEPWRYLVWDRTRDPEGWQKAFDCLSDTCRS